MSSYKEDYDKLIAHAERFGPWAESQMKLEGKIQKNAMKIIEVLKENEELANFVEELEQANNNF